MQFSRLKGRVAWVAGSKLAPVLLFISFVGFYECIIGADVIDFAIFKIVVVIRF